MKLESIPVKEIRPDFFFRFTLPGEKQFLETSLKHDGLLAPLPVYRSPQGAVLVGGFSRWQIIESMGWPEVNCTVAEAPETADQLFQAVLAQHAIEKDFTLMEKAQLARMLLSDRLSGKVRIRVLELTGLPDNESMLQRYRKLTEYAPALQNFLNRGDASIKQARRFDGLDAAAQQAFGEWGLSWMLRPVELIAIIQLCQDVAQAEGRQPQDILEREVSAAEEPENRQQSLQRLKAGLMRQRYPGLTAWREMQELDLKQLRPPAGVKIGFDATAEEPGVRLSVSLNSFRLLDELKSWLSRPETSDRLKRMIER